MKFKITTGHRKPVNKLEAHLIELATTWCKDPGTHKLEGIDQFYKALLDESFQYRADNHHARNTFINILTTVDGKLHISPTDFKYALNPTAVIEPVLIEDVENVVINYDACRQCGCTEEMACMHQDLGPCWWIEKATISQGPLCSHCVMESEGEIEQGSVERPRQDEQHYQ